ncbi:glycosyltransferase family 4 protein [Mycolicibacterium neoaurum]|uniref:glycosyltransferase family 4 protein n=1 Tax=Mycolicibacterium neoaurum TaxID=1795 RepID=UPI001F4C5958|nr:glycosyltransferase family 1 protein [Mycolicibacterium neoaurum]
MRLAINGRFLLQDVTGVQRVATEFVRALDEMLSAGTAPLLEVTLWLPARGEVKTELDLKVIRIRRVGRLSGHAWEQVELPFFSRKSVLLCLGNTAPLIRLIWNQSDTYTMIHDMSHKYFPTAYSRSFRLIYNVLIPVVIARSAHIITVSMSERDAILRHYPRIASSRRVTAVQNGGGEAGVGASVSATPTSLCPGDHHVPALDLRTSTCLYVGSLTARKNRDGLIAAAKQLADSHKVKFVFVGSTPVIFEGTYDHEKNADGLVFAGQVNDPEIVERFYREARVFVFPSFYEASPLPPIEAMSFGVPVVCSDIPSLRERCGDAAIYCDPHDVLSIVGAVSKLLSDERAWREMQTKGLSRAAQFVWQNQVRQVLAVMGCHD